MAYRKLLTTATLKPTTDVTLNRGTPLGSSVAYTWLTNEGAGKQVFESIKKVVIVMNTLVWGFGKLGKNIVSTANTNYGSTGNITTGSKYSLNIWVTPTVTPQAGYARWIETSYVSGFYLGADTTGTKYEVIVNNSGLGSLTSINNFVVGELAMLTVTVDSTILTLYVNGVKQGSITCPDLGTLTAPMYVMTYFGGVGTFGMVGSISNITIFNRAIKENEVKSLYTNPFLLYSFPNIIKRVISIAGVPFSPRAPYTTGLLSTKA